MFRLPYPIVEQTVYDEKAFLAAATRVENHIKDVYAICIITRDIPDPLIGDLNGAEIHLDHAVTPEQRLFLLGHLFGHTVQWNTDSKAYEMGQPRRAPVDEALLPTLMEYEVTAGRYARQVFHDCGVNDFDQWLADYTAADRAYLACYYRTGSREPFQSFWKGGAALLPPLPIPRFRLIPRAFRPDGIVI